MDCFVQWPKYLIYTKNVSDDGISKYHCFKRANIYATDTRTCNTYVLRLQQSSQPPAPNTVLVAPFSNWFGVYSPNKTGSVSIMKHFIIKIC